MRKQQNGQRMKYSDLTTDKVYKTNLPGLTVSKSQNEKGTLLNLKNESENSINIDTPRSVNTIPKGKSYDIIISDCQEIDIKYNYIGVSKEPLTITCDEEFETEAKDVSQQNLRDNFVNLNNKNEIIYSFIKDFLGIDLSLKNFSSPNNSLIKRLFSQGGNGRTDDVIIFLNEDHTKGTEKSKTAITRDNLQLCINLTHVFGNVLSNLFSKNVHNQDKISNFRDNIDFLVEENLKSIKKLVCDFKNNQERRFEEYSFFKKMNPITVSKIEALFGQINVDERSFFNNQMSQINLKKNQSTDDQLCELYIDSGRALLEEMQNEYRNDYKYIEIRDHIIRLEKRINDENTPKKLISTFNIIKEKLREPDWPIFNIPPFSPFETNRDQMISYIKECARKP